MKLLRKAGSTSEIWQVFIQDSSSTTGAGLTGLVNNTASLTAYYHRDTDTTATAINLATMTVGTFTSSGFKEIDNTNMPGWYQFCPPNAAITTGAKSCGIHLKGATNMAPLPIEVDLDPQVDVYLWNGTAVATPATAGIPDINAKNINNVATTSVTTINANQGTTQPVNFTGTGASALVKTDMVDIAGAAVSTTTAQIGTNVVSINSVSASSVTTVSANVGTTQPINFTGTAGSALTKADMVDIAGAAVSTSTAQVGVNVVNWGGTAVVASGVAGTPLVNIIRSNTAQSGSNINSIKLDSGASATNDLYKGLQVWIVSGTGANQVRTIITYNGTSKQASVDRQFTTSPDNTSVFALLANDSPALNANLQVTSNVATVAIRSGTAQAGSVANTIVLDSGASATNNLYSGDLITITGGTGVGQTNTIIGYNGTSKVATVASAWVTIPDATSTFSIYASTTASQFSTQGVATAGTASTITLATNASSVSEVYDGSILTILSGTDAGDTVEVTAYNGGTRVATVSPNFAVTPDTTSAYAVIPTQALNPVSTTPTATQIATSVWTDLVTGPDFQVTDSIGLQVATNLDAAISAILDALIPIDEVFTTTMTEDYAAVGAEFTLAQACYEICQSLTSVNISGVTLTARERDQSTTAMTYTLNSATVPTIRTRTT